MPPRARHEYEVTATDGSVYRVEADNDEQAAEIERFINRQIAAGVTDLSNVPESERPFNATINEPEYDTSAFGSFLRGLSQGSLANFGDELSSIGLSSIFAPQGFDFSNSYDDIMRRLSGQQDLDREQHPIASGAGEITGAVGSALAVPGGAVRQLLARAAPRALAPAIIRAEAATIGRPILTGTARGAAEGGTYGTVAGAGAGEGNRAQSAALGGLVGMLGGGAIGATVTGAAPVVARYGRMFFGRGTEREAIQQIVRALERDGYDVSSPAGVAALRTELSNFRGRPVSIADIGQATRARAGVGLRSPSDAQNRSIDQVMSRAEGQGDRLVQDIRANISPRTDVHALDDALVAQRSEEAERLRELALYEQGSGQPRLAAPQRPLVEEVPDQLDAGLRRVLGQEVEPTYARTEVPELPTSGRQSRVVDDPQLQQLARLPDAQRALQAALQRVEAERALLATMGKDISHLPDLNAGADLDVRSFDYLKRFLDTEVDSLYRRGDTSTFSAGQARQVRDLRDAIRDRLKTVVPEYADYLDQYAGSSEMIDALRAGRGRRPGEPGDEVGFDRLDPERIAQQQSERSVAGRELYRVGAARQLEDIVRDTGDRRNPAMRILNSDTDRSRLEALGLRPGAVDNLNRGVSQERQMSLLPAERSGSATDARLAAREDASSEIRVPFNPASGYGWAGAAIRGIGNKTMLSRNAAVNEEALPRLLETNPQAIDAIIDELERGGDFIRAQMLRRQRRAGQYGRGLGLTIGAPVALPQEDY